MAKRFGKSLSQKFYHSTKNYFDNVNSALNGHANHVLQYNQGDETNTHHSDDLSNEKDSYEAQRDPTVSLV